jgi:hypothetical protein
MKIVSCGTWPAHIVFSRSVVAPYHLYHLRLRFCTLRNRPLFRVSDSVRKRVYRPPGRCYRKMQGILSQPLVPQEGHAGAALVVLLFAAKIGVSERPNHVKIFKPLAGLIH